MATKEHADLVLRHYESTLLENPNVSYLSVVKRDDDDSSTDYVIEVGIIEEELNIDDDRAVNTQSLFPQGGRR